MVAAVGRPELRAIIDENDGLILDVNKHVRQAISSNVAKFQGDRGEVSALIEEIGAAIADGPGWIARHKFNDDNMAMQVDSNKVAGMSSIVAVTNDSIHLEGARIPVAQVIIPGKTPGKRRRTDYPEREHGNHADPNVEKPMQSPMLTPVRRPLFRH